MNASAKLLTNKKGTESVCYTSTLCVWLLLLSVSYFFFFSRLLSLLQLLIHSAETRGKLAEELKKADAVVLTYACDKPSTLDRISTFWLPELRRLEVVHNFVYHVGCNFIIL